MRLRLAERTGFEPAEAVNLARFPSVCLKPLDHLSKYGANLVCSTIIPKLDVIVNTITPNFKTFSVIEWHKSTNLPTFLQVCAQVSVNVAK